VKRRLILAMIIFSSQSPSPTKATRTGRRVPIAINIAKEYTKPFFEIAVLKEGQIMAMIKAASMGVESNSRCGELFKAMICIRREHRTAEIISPVDEPERSEALVGESSCLASMAGSVAEHGQSSLP